MDERLIDIFQEVEAFHWWFVGRRALLERIIGRWKQDRRWRILDVGCGTGGSWEFLSGLGTVWGIDKLPRAINHCRQKGWKKVKVADARRLPFAGRTFDVVTLLDVIEHIPGVAKAFREAKRVLRPEGMIVVTVPSLPLIWSGHDEKQGHTRRYSLLQLQREASQAGLRIVYAQHFNWLLLPPIASIRLLS